MKWFGTNEAVLQHDTTVAGLLAAMQLLDSAPGRINYTSTVIVELLTNQSVRILLKSHSER